VRTYEAMMSLDDLPSWKLTAGPPGTVDGSHGHAAATPAE
jgi:hypothetical protein